MDEEHIKMDDGVDTSLSSEGTDLFVDLLCLQYRLADSNDIISYVN